MFLDIHALHTLPYSNVNRDGLGSPKSCVYGGTQRIRISSQSWKRAARVELEERLGSPTTRTRQIAVEVCKLLIKQGWDADDARRAGRAIVQAYGLSPEDDTDITKVLLWLPSTVLDDLVVLAGKHRDLIAALSLPELDENGKLKRMSKEDKEKAKKASQAAVSSLSEPVTEILNKRSLTITLLGRMLADTPKHTVDGATQVAHAFTVHEGAPDFDYFTAVDDLAPNSGAGHLATAEFATGTFYRYCTVNVSQFSKALGDLDTAVKVVEAWARTFLTVVPSGKQSSTAARTVPDLVYMAVREAPMSLAGGFERPIHTNGKGYLEGAVSTLDSYTQRLHRFLGDQGLWSGHSGTIDTGTRALDVDAETAASGTETKTPALGTFYGSLDELIQQSGKVLVGKLAIKANA